MTGQPQSRIWKRTVRTFKAKTILKKSIMGQMAPGRCAGNKVYIFGFMLNIRIYLSRHLEEVIEWHSSSSILGIMFIVQQPESIDLRPTEKERKSIFN